MVIITNHFPTRSWNKYWRNFDSIGEAYLTLFEVASLDAWTDVMHRCMDIRGKDLEPALNANNTLVVWLFFMVFIFIGAIVMLKFFIAVVVNTYMRTFSIERFDSQQRQWIYLEKVVSQSEYSVPKRPHPGGDVADGWKCLDLVTMVRLVCYDLCIPWDRGVGSSVLAERPTMNASVEAMIHRSLESDGPESVLSQYGVERSWLQARGGRSQRSQTPCCCCCWFSVRGCACFLAA
jgi:hypothetical protein